MTSLSVSENIRIIEENIKKLTDQCALIQQEVTRLGGSLSVFKNLKKAGIENIEIPKDEVINREVTGSLD